MKRENPEQPLLLRHASHNSHLEWLCAESTADDKGGMFCLGAFFFNTQRLISDTSTPKGPFFFFLSFLHLAGETLHTTTHTEYNLTITCMDKEENTTHKYKKQGGRFSLPELNLAWIRRLFFFPQLFCFPFFFFFCP